MKRLLVTLLLVALASTVALAKPAVAVLGLEVTGTVDQPSTVAARDLTDGMRARAKVSSGPYMLAPNSHRELIDEKVLKDCGDEAPGCMAVIGRELGADVLVYGKLEKVGGGGYRVTVTALDVAKKTVLGRHVVQVAAGANGDQLRATAKKAYAELVGEIAPAGTLVVTANVGSGTVFVDDDAREMLSDGTARLSLAPGRYRVAVEAEGYRRQEVTVKIDGQGTVTESLTLRRAAGDESEGGGIDPWKPAFVVTAAATVGLAIYSTYAYSKMNEVAQDLPAGLSNQDCGPDATGTLADACGYHRKHKLTAFAAGGAGALMLVSGYFAFFHDKRGAERARDGKPALAITPQVSPSGGGAMLRLDW